MNLFPFCKRYSINSGVTLLVYEIFDFFFNFFYIPNKYYDNTIITFLKVPISVHIWWQNFNEQKNTSEGYSLIYDQFIIDESSNYVEDEKVYLTKKVSFFHYTEHYVQYTVEYRKRPA